MRHPVWYRGRNVDCPCCERSFRRFLAHNGRQGSRCPACRSAERHRLLWLFLQRETNLVTDALSVLHIAPEPSIGARLRSLPNIAYVSGDLTPGAAMEVIDITAIARPAETFDVVICNHVLEHVPDDAAAMREIFRVLRPGGVAYLQHPVDRRRATSYEDFTITDPRERIRRFGQDDHVRLYGTDFEPRLAAAGFEVTRRCYDREIDAHERARVGQSDDPGIRWSGDIYVAVKPSGAASGATG